MSKDIKRIARIFTSPVFWIIVCVSVLIGYGWIKLTPEVLEHLDLDNDQWNKASTMTTIATFAFAIGASLMVVVEFRQSTDSRNLEIYQDIYEKFMSSEQIESRRYIYTNIDTLKKENKAEIQAVIADKKAQKHIKNVLNSIDYFGFLVERDWVTDDEIVNWLSPVVVKIWVKIGPIVEYECLEREDEEPDYYRSALFLAQKCIAFRTKNYPGAQEEISFHSKKL
jgi:hypothetical protein